MQKSKFNRAIIIVLDSVGVGELPDAYKYGDKGSNTLANTAKAVRGLKLPNFQKLGFGNIIDVEGVEPSRTPLTSFGKMAEKSAGKDTTTGHWELMGLHLPNPFPVYPNGFPKEVIDEFEKKIGRKILCNKPASGTEIIKKLGEKHVKTGYPIVYTSADSVFQIAAHKEVVSLNELYKMCEIARNILRGKHSVCRVIARPFTGKPGSFVRTSERRDYSVKPPGKTVLDYAIDAGLKVFAVGKISEIFVNQGITEVVHIDNNMDGVDKTLAYMDKKDKGIIFTNLVDFDMLWGHRNNPEGYAKGLEDVDKRIPEIIENLKPNDILIFTADHGCDPTTPNTDHSREYVPLLVYGERIKPGVNLGIRKSFSDLGKTVAELMGFKALVEGESFAEIIVI
ncbi:phosphopentomutase [Candidatus Oleimmundimicrobium sp.]|uniref:phosphopentomutase n=1 Tax=Candidatus Oleimmundimicrobium sp. TaxID=3060597 RepID=UPI00272460A8|nr:phosphopentomutase [Candidatus Oleimmundimicrobium sp.]MDO8886536.1 phosphopentomutase [Candidatus Oleimmundimicrobium sp.]